MKRLFVAVVIFASMAADAATTHSNYFYRVSPANAPVAVDAVIHTVKLDYPIEAQKKRFIGKGLFAIHIRSNGTVESVEVVQSTGHSILDKSAIVGLRQWHFRPGTLKLVRTPVVYEIGHLRLPKPGYGDLKNPGDGLQVTVHVANPL